LGKSNGGGFDWLEPVRPAGTPAGMQTGTEEKSYEIPGTRHPTKRRRNRAKTGKRSDPNYVMAGAYIERGVRERVDRALTEMREPGGKKVEYSDLVQSLLVRWLEEIGESDEG
jgi:hypothetical protein